MQNDYQNNMDASIRKAMALAKTPAGQQLLSALQKSGSDEVRAVMERAASGDLQEAKKAAATLLNNPEIRALMEQLGR